MTPIPPYRPGQSFSDWATSVIRTVVPVLWGALITYLAGLVPAVAHLIDPSSVVDLGPAVAAVVASVWYAVMRKIEPSLPAWLTVIVLGSNKTPLVYVDPASPPVPPAAAPGQVVD
jgi:hypothetical protein